MKSSQQLLLLLILSILMVWTEAQSPKPAAYPWDCRRSNVKCKNSGSCDINNGSCSCSEGFEGHDCGVTSSLKLGDACPTEDKCENNGVCLQNKACYCGSDTYGAKCENPRVKMWCSATQMFINIYPHADSDFSGKIYLKKTSGDSASDVNCLFTVIDTTGKKPDLSLYKYVQTAQKTPLTEMKGYYIVQDHVPAAGASDSCQAAVVKNTTERTDYLQTVIIVYNPSMTTSVDSKVIVNCSLIKTSENTPYTSENAFSIPLDSNDLTPVNVTDTIVPVTFEIRNPSDNSVITNNVNLGDALSLVFTMKITGTPTGSALKAFKVTQCTATNGQPAQDDKSNTIEFLEKDCPKQGSEMLWRGQVSQTTNTTQVQTVVPLSAFRFVGNFDDVAFTCSLKLCTADELANNSTACTKNPCTGQTSTPATSAPTTIAPATNAPATNAPATTAPATTAPAGRRRRRRSADSTEKKVTQSMKVNSAATGDAQTGSKPEPEKKEEEAVEDCMQHSEVVIIIAIFSSILFLLLLALVILVVNFLRSRQKVVNTPAPSCADSQCHYSLPRLSLATTM